MDDSGGRVEYDVGHCVGGPLHLAYSTHECGVLHQSRAEVLDGQREGNRQLGEEISEGTADVYDSQIDGVGIVEGCGIDGGGSSRG